MLSHVFVVSEWLPKPGYEQELFRHFKKLMSLSRKEPGCVSAHATKQISHPGSPSTSKYSIVLLQEYIDISAFEYVTGFFKDFIENKETSIVEDWKCRLFSEPEE